MGRVLDSAMVLLTGMLRVSELPAIVVLAVDIAGLAAILVLMTLNGNFSFAAPAPAAPALPGEEERLDRFADRYGLSPAESRVLRELVCTEDKQTAIYNESFYRESV